MNIETERESIMFDDEDRTFVTVRNAEAQYSLWPADRAVPDGWTAVGEPGSRADRLDHIRREWTDLRPAGLRAWMGG